MQQEKMVTQMTTFETVKDLFTFWSNVRGSFYLILKYISDEDLAHAPWPTMKSLGDLLTHIPAAYHWWLEYIIKDGKGIKPPAKPCQTVEEIQSLFKTAHDRLEEFINELTWQSLKQEHDVRDGNQTKKVTTYWILWHLAEHDIHHRAQVKMYLTHLGKKIDERDFWNQPVL